MIIIKKTVRFLMLCCCIAYTTQNTFAQNNLTVENISTLNSQLFCLITATDTIHFIKYDTINEKKPLFLFISGSLPMPLIIDYGKAYGNAMATNFFHLLDKQIFDNFNVVSISQPNVPPIIAYEYLDERGAYKNSDLTFTKRNVSETYVERTNEVINHLLQQNWIDGDSIYIFGHSQGAYIAARVAAENKTVKAIAFASTNPFGRVHGLIQTVRASAAEGKQTEDEAQKQVEYYWKLWDYMRQIDTLPASRNYDLPATWVSFTNSVVDILANLKQPVFIAYGTRDYQSVACELLPIYFGFAKKHNYKMFPVTGRGHNFELLDDNGNSNWEDTKWKEVVVEFMKFIKTQKE